MATRKRFIAGAICPQCSAEDTTYVLVTADGQSRHCNQCSFNQNMSDLSPASEVEPVSDWQPIKLTD